MKTTIKTITPEWAKSILETKNPRNRPLSETFVSRLARDIKCGAFVTTHQGIAFDEAGDLLDGQHRLAACVLADMPITLPVTTDMVSRHKLNGSFINTFELIDGGKPRGVGQLLQMAGYTNGHRVAATAKAAVLFAARQTRNVSISTAQAHKALMYFGTSVNECVTVGMSGKIFRPQSWILGPACIYHSAFPDQARDFLQQVGDVTGVSGSASRALASYTNSHSASGGQQQVSYYKVAASAIKHHHEGSRVSKIYGTEDAADWLLSLNKPLVTKLTNIIDL